MKRQLILFAVSAFAFAVFGAESNQPLDARESVLRKGHEAFAVKNFTAARAEYAALQALTNATPAHRSIAQLRIAQSYLRAGDLAAARSEYAKVAAIQGAPAHHRWEAEQQLRELERRQQGHPARDPMASRVHLPPMPKPGATLHVSPRGVDTHPGTAQRPFATVERARDEIRALRQRSGLPAGGVTVLVQDGDYRVSRTFKLSSEDSGTQESPVVYRAADGESPRFVGGARLDGFQLVKDAAILQRLPEAARGKVYQVDLQARGLTNLPPVRLGGFSSGVGFRTHPVAELFFEGKALPLARWPNDRFVTVTDVQGPTPITAHGLKGSKEGVFTYEGDRPLRWTEDKDVLLYGYWFWGWADSYERVASIDTAKRQITLAPPYHTYGYRKGQTFYALNLLSEIDQPGEWYLDRAAGVLYLYPPADPAKAVIELSLSTVPFVELTGASHLRLEGLTWDLGCVDGVLIRGGERCLLAGCTVKRLGGNGVEIHGGKAHGVLSCDIFSLGRGGVVMDGGDRKALTPGGHFVENCRISDLSRVDHTYTPAILLSGVGNRVAHNLMHDILSSALRVGGNDHLLEFNEVCRVVLESDDQGGVDMHGNPTYRGNVFRYNYWHHIGNWRNPGVEPACGQAGIRFDDAICGQLVYGNIFRRCAAGKLGFGGVQIHGGKENTLDNNLFVDCATAVSFSPWGQAYWLDFTKGKFPSRDTDEALYVARYPELARLNEDLNVNHLWRNLVVNCGEFLRRNRAALLIDNLQSTDGSGFKDAASGDFTIAETAALLDRVSFEPIPFEEIGLYRDAWRKELPAASIRQMRSGK